MFLSNVHYNDIYSSSSFEGGICLKGAIRLRTDVKQPYWLVEWPEKGKVYKISRYLGEAEVMYRAHNDKKRDLGYQKACKLLALMQGDFERKIFRIDKYLGKQLTDTIPYLEQWLKDREPTLTPGGYEKYNIAVYKHLIPFFEKHPLMLHEIKYDTLIQLLNWIPGQGKNKKNVIDTLKTCLRYAWKAERIVSLPPFPEKDLYDITDNPPEWLPYDRFMNVINHIPDIHRPFFMWLYLHLRRPGEAMALLKTDYNPDADTFTIHRGVSAHKVIDRTKTGDVHEIPCHSEFKSYMAKMPKTFSPYFFTHPESNSDGQRYTGAYYRSIWNAACLAVGEKIDVYRGTKTSRASQLVNQGNLSLSDLQIAGDWSSFESVKSYARANMVKKRAIMETKIIPFPKLGEATGKNDKF
jgi:integrase